MVTLIIALRDSHKNGVVLSDTCVFLLNRIGHVKAEWSCKASKESFRSSCQGTHDGDFGELTAYQRWSQQTWKLISMPIDKALQLYTHTANLPDDVHVFSYVQCIVKLLSNVFLLSVLTVTCENYHIIHTGDHGRIFLAGWHKPNSQTCKI